MQKRPCYSLLFLSCLSTAIVQASAPASKPDFKAQAEDGNARLYNFITVDNQPSKTLVDLLGKCGVKHTGTLESIKAATQKKQSEGGWIRATAEREDAPEIYTKMREELLPLYTAFGMVQAHEPAKKHYDHVVVLSNMLTPFRQRLAFVHEHFKKGVTMGKVHLVGSERVLSPVHESAAALCDAANKDLPCRKDWTIPTDTETTHVVGKGFTPRLPKTDTPMLELVYDQADLSSEFRAITCVGLNVPNQVKADGAIARATTETQVVEWVKKNPTSGNTLWISNNPYNAYQHSVVATYAPSVLSIETAGPAADIQKPNLNADVLDTVARIIYQETVRRKLNENATAAAKK